VFELAALALELHRRAPLRALGDRGAGVRRRQLGGGGRQRRLVTGRAVGGRVGGGIGLGHGLVVGIGLLAVGRHVVAKRLAKGALRLVERDAVLGPLGPGEAWLDGVERERHLVREGRLLGVLVMPQALLLGVGLDER